MLLSLPPFESHQDLLSSGFVHAPFLDDMSLPLDFKQTPAPPAPVQLTLPHPAPVDKAVSSGSNKRKRSAPASDPRPVKRVAPTTPRRPTGDAPVDTAAAAASPESDKKRNKLGYHRTSVACSHCRRRKIRCMVPDNDTTGRCANCVRLKKECTFCPVEDSVAPKRPQTTGSIAPPGMLPSPEPLVKGSVPASSISPAMSSSQARDLVPASSVDGGLGIFGPTLQSRDPSNWYPNMAGWSDKSHPSNIFAATPLSAKSPNTSSAGYGMPSPYPMAASSHLYPRPQSSMTPQSDDGRGSNFRNDLAWVQPGGRSMSYADNYSTHNAQYPGAANMMQQPRRSMTLPSSSMAFPDPSATSLSMNDVSMLVPSTSAQSMQWNGAAMWDHSAPNKDMYGQDAYAYDASNAWYGNGPPGGSF